VRHNVVQLLFGVAGLPRVAPGPLRAAYLVGGGVIYFVLWVYGSCRQGQQRELRPGQHRAQLASLRTRASPW